MSGRRRRFGYAAPIDGSASDELDQSAVAASLCQRTPNLRRRLRRLVDADIHVDEELGWRYYVGATQQLVGGSGLSELQ
ncbi:MAG TPA: hypothetical protein VFZ40_00155 [Pyrinomonadaceae bacterium]